jgi:hypothetical protein
VIYVRWPASRNSVELHQKKKRNRAEQGRFKNNLMAAGEYVKVNNCRVEVKLESTLNYIFSMGENASGQQQFAFVICINNI